MPPKTESAIVEVLSNGYAYTPEELQHTLKRRSVEVGASTIKRIARRLRDQGRVKFNAAGRLYIARREEADA